MRLHTDFFEKLHEKFPNIQEDAVIEGFYKFLKDITIESNIDYPSEIDISTVTGTSIKFTDTKGNTIGIIEPVKKENFNHGIQLRVDDQVLGLFISDEHIATAIAPTPVPMQEGGNPKSIVTLDSFKQLAIYTLEELGLSFTEDGFLEIDKGDDSLSSVGFVKQQLDALKQEILDMIRTNDEINRLAALPKGSIIIWTSEDIPNGWAICDGTNGTPDLRDRFIVGAGNTYTLNATGGENTVTLTDNQVGNHYHAFGYHNNDNNGTFLSTGGSLKNYPLASGTQGAYWNGNNGGGDHGKPTDNLNLITSLGVSTVSTSTPSAHENRPPYYSVYYIMKIGVETPPPTPEPPEIPDYTTPEGVVEGVLTPHTLKVRFDADSWYHDPGRFSMYNNKTKTWVAATKIVDNVVYFIFTEEEITNEGKWVFTKHPPIPIQELNLENVTHKTNYRDIGFLDTFSDHVFTIYNFDGSSGIITVGSAYI